MTRIVILVLLQLLAPYLEVVGSQSIPYAYADSDSDSDSDGDSDDGEDSDDSDDSEAESESGSPSGNTENESKDTEDANDESDNSTKRSVHINRSGSNSRDNGSNRSHQRSIRNAVQQNQILPLGEIKRHIENKTKSEIIYIELEKEHGQWVYEFKIIDRRGHLREIYVDAANGKILKSEPIGKRSR